MQWIGLALAVTVVAGAAWSGAFHAPQGNLSASLVLPLAAAVALIAAPAVFRFAPRSTGWLILTLLGWGATLVLIDAPPAVAYQHLRLNWRDPLRLVALLILAAQLVAVLTVGREHVAALARWCRGNLRAPLLMLAVLCFVLPAAVPSADLRDYALELGVSTLLQLLTLITVIAAARRVPDASWVKAAALLTRVIGAPDTPGPRRIDGWVLRLAAAAVLVAAALSWFVYQAHPHVPDEVVYLLHARYLADGMVTMPLPPVPAAFNIDLMHYEPTRWFSPVTPGWPLVLSVGAWLGVPWLVNPVLGGCAIVLTYLLLGRMLDTRETRLATLMLASSPWFLFMSMNLMTHTVTLVLALLAALGVVISRQSGSWRTAFAGGLAVGAIALVRPLEGVVTAVVLGFWSLGARGTRFRLAPSTALVLGTVVTGLLVRPYNARITGSPDVFPINAYVDKYYLPGSNALGFGPDRGIGWGGGLDPFPGHDAKDVVINAALNTAQTNIELLGWPVGGVVIVSLALLIGGPRVRRVDRWFVAVIAAVVGAHSFYYFSGGPDFGARYWYLIIVPCCALAARGLGLLDETAGGVRREGASARTVALFFLAATLLIFVPWRAIGKYRNYRGMRADVRQLARDAGFGRSLVLVRGARFPDYASSAIYNPIDLHADAPIYAWDASAEIRTALLNAYPDRPVWIIDGPSITRGDFRVIAGPLSHGEARASQVPSSPSSGEVYNPVFPPVPGTGR
jgi:4-amino-4-deoxy-L-arabinose transferase-like glycosyltransferase